MSNSPDREQPAPPSPPSQNNKPQSHPRSQFPKGRRTKIAIALASVAALAAGAYIGTKYLLQRKLYPMLETLRQQIPRTGSEIGKTAKPFPEWDPHRSGVYPPDRHGPR